MAGSFDALKCVIFQVVQIKSNGNDVAKLTADAIRAASEGLANGVAPATEAAKGF